MLPQPARTTSVVEWDGGQSRRRLDDLAAEEPLEIRVDGTAVSVTMRTPGDDFDLAAGFLLTEGIVTDRDQIAGIAHARGSAQRVSANVVDVALAPGTVCDLARLDRHVVATSSCGVCGKTSIDAVRARGIRRLNDGCMVGADVLAALPDTLRAAQRVFSRTGGLHAAGLFEPGGALIAAREDVGRHNAVDKIIGHALRSGWVPLSHHLLVVSGRGGFEIVQKALVAGVPIVACVSAPSSLAVQLARHYGQTLVGFLRGTRFVVYAGDERIGAADGLLA